MRKIRWGVLGAAKIATDKVIPAMQRGQWSTVAAIASRDLEKARSAAAKLGIAKAYGSYEELVADKDIDAVYNPLPNHLHVPWTIRAAEGGKHVLCEKPIALSAAEARQLLAVRDRTGVQNSGSVHGAHAPAVADRQGAGDRAAGLATCDPYWARSATPIATRRTSATAPSSAAAR